MRVKGTLARHAATRTQYNVLDKITQQTDAQGYVNKTEYNAFGNTTQMQFNRKRPAARSIKKGALARPL